MSRTRSIALVVITVGVTLGSGLVAENRDAIEARLGAEGPRPAAAPILIAVSGMPSLVTAPGGRFAGAPSARGEDPWLRVVGAPAAQDGGDGWTSLVPALAEAGLRPLDPGDLAWPGSFAEASPAAPPSASLAASLAPADACSIRVEAAPAPAATVDLAVWAPCAPGEALTVSHEGLALRVALDAEGRASLQVPALATPAAFALAAGGAAAVAMADVPDLSLYDRAVLQWRGAEGPALRARAFGAGPGEVRAAGLGGLAATPAGVPDLVVTLGDATLPSPLMAQVYTDPSGAGRRAGAVSLAVEARVSEATCGRVLEAELIRLAPGAAPTTTAIALPMPGCEALGAWVALDAGVPGLAVAAL